MSFRSDRLKRASGQRCRSDSARHRPRTPLTLLMRAARRQGMLRAVDSPYGLGARLADASTHLPGLASWRTAGCAAV